MAEMMKAVIEGMMAEEIVAAKKAVTETRAEAVAAESLGHGVSLRQYDRKQNRRGHRNGFSQTHRSLTAGPPLSAFAAINSTRRPRKRTG